MRNMHSATRNIIVYRSCILHKYLPWWWVRRLQKNTLYPERFVCDSFSNTTCSRLLFCSNLLSIRKLFFLRKMEIIAFFSRFWMAHYLVLLSMWHHCKKSSKTYQNSPQSVPVFFATNCTTQPRIDFLCVRR